MAKPIRIPITFTSDPKAIKKTQKQLADFGKQAGKIVAGVGVAVAGLGAVSVRAFAEFDAAMVKSTAIMGDVSDAMKGEMSDAAREVAKATTFSAAQAAESFFFLASKPDIDSTPVGGARPASEAPEEVRLRGRPTGTSPRKRSRSAEIGRVHV